MHKSLNDLTEEDFEEIKNLAALFYTPKEISIILEVDAFLFSEACLDDGCRIYQAFFGGRLLSETELRSSILKTAKAGSSPAQTMALQMMQDSKMNMLDL